MPAAMQIVAAHALRSRNLPKTRLTIFPLRVESGRDAFRRLSTQLNPVSAAASIGDFRELASPG
jgi:O-acetylhomoserine/O-acetylserine sulfhydrylase-like pyridoxal-dependent enzyme